MRFIMLLKADKNTEAGVMPDEKIMVAMGKYNEALVNAGALVTGEGLQESSKGFRVRNSGGTLTVIDGPFTEAKELIAGYWMIRTKSKEEAIEWTKKVPFEAGGPSATGDGDGQIEIRQVFELEDFPVNENESGWREQEADFRAEGSGKSGAPVPDETKLKYMMMFKSDARSEAGVLPDEKMLAERGR